MFGTIHSKGVQEQIPIQYVYSWGDSANYATAQGTTTDVQTPMLVGTHPFWKTGGGGTNQTFLIKSDGTLWGIGNNTYYQLGLGHNTTPVTGLTQIGTDKDWKMVIGGAESTLAIKHNGTLWAWGSNRKGECGVGNTSQVTTPTQVGSDTDWKKVSMQWQSAIGLKYNGTVYTWGFGVEYATGQNTTSDITTPTQLSGLTGIVDVCNFTYSNLALKSDGTLWGWGGNSKYELGLGNTTTPKTPVQIGSDTDWAKIGAHYYTGTAIKTNGKLYTWGYTENTSYNTGQNTTANITTPTKYNDDTNWYQIPAKSYRNSFSGLKTDKKRYYYGYGADYRNGNASTTAIRIPTKYNDDTYIAMLNGCANHNLGLRFIPYREMWNGLTNYFRLEDATDSFGSYTFSTVTDVDYVAGKHNNAADFNGSSSYMQGGAFNFSAAGSMSVWIKQDSTAASRQVMDGGSNGTGTTLANQSGINIQINNGTAYIAIRKLNTGTFINFGSFGTGAWKHLVYTWNGTERNLYVNGLLHSSLIHENLGAFTGQIIFGRRLDGANYHDGGVDECAIFNRVLEAPEAAALYNAGNGIYY